MPKTTALDREMPGWEFFRRLGVSRPFYYRLRAQGVMPDPPRLKGSRSGRGGFGAIRWTEAYLAACREALRANRELEHKRRHLTREKAKELHDAGVL
jgi:predicted DNA-binding transcriptional regulator AlpA